MIRQDRYDDSLVLHTVVISHIFVGVRVDEVNNELGVNNSFQVINTYGQSEKVERALNPQDHVAIPF